MFVAGTGRFCTDVMAHFGARVFVKTGAEGVFCGALPEMGLGIAIKCDDGGKRAAETMMAAQSRAFCLCRRMIVPGSSRSCGRHCITGMALRSDV